MVRSKFVLLVIVVVLPSRGSSCFWDSDTLAAESRDKPGIVEIITGRFERNPPEYYEIRLARVSRELEESPDRLDLYDDAAVACDRLHRSDEALQWLEKKHLALLRLSGSPEEVEHLYRYHANLGTVLAHRWIRAGAQTSTLSEMKEARTHIAKAIELNPEAHFGREKYQLMAMDWIIKTRSDERENNLPKESFDPRTFIPFSEDAHRAMYRPESSLDEELADAVEGVSGLIFLGDAWQSIDVFYALQTALQADGFGRIALLAQLRREELENSGFKSLHPPLAELPEFRKVESVDSRSISISFFKRARAEADNWHRARMDYFEARFAEGKHPDTDPDFWRDFSYRRQPPLFPFELNGHRAVHSVIMTFILVPMTIVACVMLARAIRWRKRRVSV